jgi:hypothetical protein
MEEQPATAAKQEDIKTALALLATEAKLEAVRLLLAGTLVVSGPAAAALATAAKQDDTNNWMALLAKEATLGTLATEATQVLHPTIARIGTPMVPITTGAITAPSAAITGTCVRLVATKDCHIAFGADPSAGPNDPLLAAGIPEYFWVTNGHKVAAIQDSEAGKVHVTPVTFA